MRLRENGWLIGLAAFALAGNMACQRQPDATRGYGSAAEDRTEDRDTRITTSVQARFYSDEQIRGRHIEVHTDDAVVTLRGSVETEQARERAIEIARGVEGVQRVEDNLQVGAPVATTGRDPMTPGAPRTDRAPDRGPADTAERREGDTGVNAAWITTKIQAQYFVTPGVAPWKVDVTTSASGVVTLDGEVDSVENRQRAVQIARDTEGVARVDDRLRVSGERDEPAATTGVRDADRADDGLDRPDVWITTKVQSKYFLDDDVRGRNIDVTTNEGIVTLRGTVHNERERRQAVALARNTDGVSDVRDELTMEPAAEADRDTRPQPDAERRDTATGKPAPDPDRTADRTAGEQFDDGWITTKVQSQLYLEQDVRGRNIDIQTRDGVVTLRGQVESDAARQIAERIARETDGVRRVENQLTVGPQTGTEP
jgi:hyperosmotically inducible periplasmic protein